MSRKTSQRVGFIYPPPRKCGLQLGFRHFAIIFPYLNFSDFLNVCQGFISNRKTPSRNLRFSSLNLSYTLVEIAGAIEMKCLTKSASH